MTTYAELEPHPILHDFTIVNDLIAERNSRKVPVLIRREERCEYCNTQRFTRINVRQWTIVGSRQYRYPKDIKIVRISKAEWTKQQFMNSTTLVTEDHTAYEALL
jgi:hypothetical protein